MQKYHVQDVLCNEPLAPPGLEQFGDTETSHALETSHIFLSSLKWFCYKLTLDAITIYKTEHKEHKMLHSLLCCKPSWEVIKLVTAKGTIAASKISCRRSKPR